MFSPENNFSETSNAMKLIESFFQILIDDKMITNKNFSFQYI